MNTSHKKYLLSFSIILFLSLFSIGIFNYLIDPHDYFKTPLFSLNKNKSFAFSNRLDCALKIMCQKPESVLLGSSRVVAGFRTEDYKELSKSSAYKSAFSGARFDEIYHYFHHALHNQPAIKNVFIGLDFFAFSKTIKPVSEFSLERLNRKTPLLNERFKLFFGLPTIKKSYQIIWENTYKELVFTESKSRFEVDEGQFVSLATFMLDSPQLFLIPEIQYSLKNYQIDDKKIAMFEEITSICKEKNIDLKVAFIPSHALYFETIDQLQLWNDFETLKSRLCAFHPIYDFSGYTTYNSQPLPTMQKDCPYYLEISHFRHTLGKEILQHMYGIKEANKDTGFLLTKDTIETHLATLRQQKQDWQKKHPEQVIWISKVIAEAAEK